jgi:zinc D-Ala-D-Ala carboxypeptidase
MKTRKKKNKKKILQVILIILVVMLVILLVFSRGYRAARRVSVPSPPPVNKENIVHADHAEKPAITMQDSDSKIIESVSREALLGHVDPSTDDDFVLIDAAFANRSGMYLRLEAYDAFLAMREAALTEGIELTVLSATRDFQHQKRIWENKWHGRQILHGNILANDIPDPAERALEILRFSAMPGTSRHHWGTDIDLNSLNNSYFESGEGLRVYEWLRANAAGFGFCQPYTRHGQRRQGGYEEEKWHWSYKPIASIFLKAYKDKVSYEDISGFAGWGTAAPLQVIERFVFDVNEDCR